MVTVLNVLHPKPLANEVHTLDNMTKAQIMSAIEEALSARGYQLAPADTIAPIDKRDPETLSTPGEWLEERCIEWGKSDRRKFEMRLSKLYKDKYGEQPRKAVRFGSEEAKWKKSVNVYDPEKDSDIFKSSLEYVRQQQIRKKPKVTS
jgi:hypothetical protein